MVTRESTEREEEGTEEGLNAISGTIIGAAIQVHRALGPGLLESAYQACLEREVVERGHRVERQRSFPIVYKGTMIRQVYRPDMVVDSRVLVEIKAVAHLLPVHEAQILSYLRLASLPLGLLINFHHATLKAGIRRFRFSPSVPSSPLCALNEPNKRR